MRHKLPILVALLALAGMTFVVAASGGGNGAARIPSPVTPFDLPSSCAFPVHVEPGAQNAYIIHYTTLADGTQITQTTGRVFVTFTNTGSGKTYGATLSGLVVQTAYPDGKFVFDGKGLNLWGFNPLTGGPGILITSGHAVATFDTSGLTSFTLDGSQTNVCALLAP